MCGINGLYKYDLTINGKSIIEKMNDRIAHRGPDASGCYHSGRVHLGHRRLAVIDVDEHSNQPFHSNDGKHILIYNGEIYNYKKIKEEIKDYDFKTTSDTEMIVAAYQKWGKRCFEKFNGMFALALFDLEKDEILLARDRLGIKPLYYYADDKKVLFSSEIKALLSSELIPKKVDENSVLDYLRYQTVHAPKTIIKDLLMLMPGHTMLINDEGIKIEKFWELAENRDNKFLVTDEKSAQQQVKKLFFESVEKRMIADVPLGAFLSGGIDSSAIVGAMSHFSNKSIKTFSVVFEEEEFSEAVYARKVAEKFKTDHHEINLKPSNLLDELENALSSMDHPTADGINSYVVSKATKEAGITVALSGLGGDEVFAGYPVFRQMLELQTKKWMLSYPKFMRKIAGKAFTGMKRDVASQKTRQIMELDYFEIPYAYPISRQSFSDKQIRGMLNIEQMSKNRVSDIVEKQLSYGQSAFQLPYISKLSIAEISTYLQNVLLRDTDMMSMAHALEVRVPFLDHELIEYVLQLPDEYKMKKSQKALLTESLGDLIPSDIIHRPKMGFVFPWEHWLKSELKEFAEKNIKSLASRPFMNEKGILDIWDSFLEGKSSISWSRIWSLVVLGYWLEKNVG